MRIFPRNGIAMVALASVVSLGLAACGQQSDDRVDDPTTAGVEDSTSEESLSDGSGDEDAALDAAEAASPFVTVDCVSMQVMPVDAPPANAVTVGDASAIFQPNGAPALTLATSTTPAESLGIADIREGDGAEVQPGDTVTVNYCGVGYTGQVVFDSSWSRGEPISFPLDGLIPGWQEGIPGMKVGGQRLLVIPGALGYGESGAPGIAPNETLFFVIELLDSTS